MASAFSYTVKLGYKELFGCPKIVPYCQKFLYPYEVNGKLVTGNGSLIHTNLFLIKPSLTVIGFDKMRSIQIAKSFPNKKSKIIHILKWIYFAILPFVILEETHSF